jgi:hypothetical protein
MGLAMVTHPSHFDVSIVSRTSDRVILEGSLPNIKRVVFASGLVIGRKCGRIVSSDSRGAVYAHSDDANFMSANLEDDRGEYRGMIQRMPEGWCAVIHTDLFDAI